MIEFYIRLIIVTLICLVVVYYAYLLAQGCVISKQAHRKPTNESIEHITLIKQKFVPTVCYLLCMAIVGVLYIVGIDIGIMSCVLMILNVLIAFIGDKKIMSWADLRRKKQ
jgi:uncharacterized membrane protein